MPLPFCKGAWLVGVCIGCLQEVLQSMEQRARALARSVRYVGAATAEFLYCVEDQGYYFLELNPRLQVSAGPCLLAVPAQVLSAGAGIGY